MKYPDELCQLVIRNMAIVEEAPSVVDEVEKTLFAAINERISDRVAELDEWKGCYDFVTDKDDEETTFALADWPEDEAGVYLAWYKLWGVEYDEVSHWLSCAAGFRNTALCLLFEFSNELGGLSTKERKKRCQDFFAATPALQQAGFRYNKSGYFYLPFTLDSETLAAEFPDFDTTFAPLDKALDSLFAVHPVFDGLVREIITQGT